jgi:heavy metal sensor kinase
MKPRVPSLNVRGLRFRLTASYALFFTLLITVVSILFRQYLANSLDKQAQDILEQEWGVVKGYLRVENGHVSWHFDLDDPDEAAMKARLQRVYLLTDSQGKFIEGSPAYRELGMDTPEEVQAAVKSGQTVWKEKRDPDGVPYQIRGGVIMDEYPPRRYYVALGFSLDANQKLLRGFTLVCAGVIPLMILTGSLMGWILLGRGLTPVTEVAKTAQRITGSNLSLRIPNRRAGDELDFLIETFNQMIERLESSFGQIRQFSTDVSHELRTPLTILRGQLEVALFTAETKEQYREAIIDSLQDIERLGQIVRALLLLSQAESGQVILQRVVFDLAAVLRDITDQFQIPAEGAQVKLSVTGPEYCEADLDRVQIERMLSNLLSNAIKFTPPGGVVRVSLEYPHDRPQDEAILTIADTGRGISAEHQPHIFDRFYRVGDPTQAASPEKGLGLGLSFVAWIVKAHQGTIQVESEQGRGTRFVVTIPLRAPGGDTGLGGVLAEETAGVKKV